MLIKLAYRPRGVPAMLLVAFALVCLTACNDSGDGTPAIDTPTTAPTQVAEVTPSPVPTATLPADSVAPQAGLPCPIEAAICDFAVRLLPTIAAGDVDAFMALTEPVPVVCTGRPGFAGFGGPSEALCVDAAAGETRFGYWDSLDGHGFVVTEAEFRSSLGDWFGVIAQAHSGDEYGSGNLRIGSVACARLHSEPAGICSRGLLRIHFTLIRPLSSPNQSGELEERMSYHVSLHEAADGDLAIDGVGWSHPPNAVLEAFSLDAQTDKGEIVLLEFYPWTP